MTPPIPKRAIDDPIQYNPDRPRFVVPVEWDLYEYNIHPVFTCISACELGIVLKNGEPHMVVIGELVLLLMKTILTMCVKIGLGMREWSWTKG